MDYISAAFPHCLYSWFCDQFLFTILRSIFIHDFARNYYSWFCEGVLLVILRWGNSAVFYPRALFLILRSSAMDYISAAFPHCLYSWFCDQFLFTILRSIFIHDFAINFYSRFCEKLLFLILREHYSWFCGEEIQLCFIIGHYSWFCGDLPWTTFQLHFLIALIPDFAINFYSRFCGQFLFTILWSIFIHDFARNYYAWFCERVLFMILRWRNSAVFFRTETFEQNRE